MAITKPKAKMSQDADALPSVWGPPPRTNSSASFGLASMTYDDEGKAVLHCLHCPFVQGQTNNHSDQTDQQCETARHSERLTLALKEARAENDRLKLTNSELEAQLQAARM